MEVELQEGDDAAPAAGQCKIDTNYPPKNFKDAMRRTDRQEWTEAYDKEYQGFKEHGTLKVVRPVPGVKILGTTTRTEYKVDRLLPTQTAAASIRDPSCLNPSFARASGHSPLLSLVGCAAFNSVNGHSINHGRHNA